MCVHGRFLRAERRIQLDETLAARATHFLSLPHVLASTHTQPKRFTLSIQNDLVAHYLNVEPYKCDEHVCLRRAVRTTVSCRQEARNRLFSAPFSPSATVLHDRTCHNLCRRSRHISSWSLRVGPGWTMPPKLE